MDTPVPTTPPPPPPPRARHRPSGYCPLRGFLALLVQGALLALAGALALSLLRELLSPMRSSIFALSAPVTLLLALLTGLALGGLFRPLLRRARCRDPLAAYGLALLLGAAAWLGGYYADYQRLRTEFAEALASSSAAAPGPRPYDSRTGSGGIDEYLDGLTARASGLAESAEDARAARRRLGGCLGYLGWLARRYGERPNLVARLWPALGRVAPQLAGWLLLALATFLAASAAGRRALGAAEAPYCDECDRWCERLELVAGRGLLPRLAELLPDLRAQLLGGAPFRELRLDACPDCLETAWLSVRDPARLPGRRTRLRERELTGQELRALRRLFRPPPAGAPAGTPPPAPLPSTVLFEYYAERCARPARLERLLGRSGAALLALGLGLALLAPADAARAEVGWPPAGGIILAGLLLVAGRLAWAWLWRGRMLARWCAGGG